MKKINSLLIFLVFLMPLGVISQIPIPDIPVLLKTEKTVYTIDDTLKLTFSFDTLEVIHSNFGGCGNGPIFMVRNIDKPESGDLHPAYCDYLEFFSFSNQGAFEIPILEPGTYYVVFYIKNHKQDFVSSDRWKNPIRSNEFEVVKTKAAIDSKLKNSNPIEYGRFIRGGEEIQYDKEWNKIGIVFEAGFTNYLPFLTKFNLEQDNEYSNRNFTVFRLIESLSLEKRKRLMESIKEEKYVKVIGDILSGSIISEQIIVRWNKQTTDSEEINKILKEEGLEISQQTTINGTILNVSNPFNYRVIEVCNKLMNSGLVTFAEPDLYLQITY